MSMRCFKILLKTVKKEDTFGDYYDKDEVKLGEVAFDFKGKLEDEEISLKKGDQVYYQYGNPAKLDGMDYVVISLNSIVCLK